MSYCEIYYIELKEIANSYLRKIICHMCIVYVVLLLGTLINQPCFTFCIFKIWEAKKIS